MGEKMRERGQEIWLPETFGKKVSDAGALEEDFGQKRVQGEREC